MIKLAKGAESPAREFSKFEGNLVLIKTVGNKLAKGFCKKVFSNDEKVGVNMHCTWMLGIAFPEDLPLDMGKVGVQKLLWISPLWHYEEKQNAFWLSNKSNIQLIGEIPIKFLEYLFEEQKKGNIEHIEFYHKGKYEKISGDEIVEIAPDEIKTVYYSSESYSTSEICNIRLKKL